MKNVIRFPRKTMQDDLFANIDPFRGIKVSTKEAQLKERALDLIASLGAKEPKAILKEVKSSIPPPSVETKTQKELILEVIEMDPRLKNDISLWTDDEIVQLQILMLIRNLRMLVDPRTTDEVKSDILSWVMSDVEYLLSFKQCLYVYAVSKGFTEKEKEDVSILDPDEIRGLVQWSSRHC